MLILKKEVDLVWVAQETLRKSICFGDLVWSALLFHANIEEISRFSVAGSINIRKSVF